MAARKKRDALTEKYRVPAGGKFQLKSIDPDDCGSIPDKQAGRKELQRVHDRLVELQEVLYAQARYGLLVVLQAMDTGGKDSTIRHVFGPLNPQGVRVTGFKVPTPEEHAHDYLWRIHVKAPRKGMVRIFNRSHYEDVLVTRVHRIVPEEEIRKRYAQINAFEKYLTENGIRVLKFYLHIGKDEQRRRLQARLDRPDKHWKFSSADLAERKRWPDYRRAYEQVLRNCSTAHAPWYVVPGNHKWFRDVVISRVVLQTLESMNLKFPPPEPGIEKIVID